MIIVFRGYIALTSSLIICALLLIATLAAHTEAFAVQHAVQNQEGYQTARELAESCRSLVKRARTIDPGRFEEDEPIHIFFADQSTCMVYVQESRIHIRSHVRDHSFVLVLAVQE